MGRKPDKLTRDSSGRRSPEDFRPLSIRILHYANRGVSLVAFFRQLSKILRDFSMCDAVELRATDGGAYYCARAENKPGDDFTFRTLSLDDQTSGCDSNEPDAVFEELCRMVMKGELHPDLTNRTKNGSLWINDADKPLKFNTVAEQPQKDTGALTISGKYQSTALIPFVLEDDNIGLLILQSIEKFFFTESEVIHYEFIAQTLGLAIADRKARAMCNERVKELTCLYGITNISSTPGLSLVEILESIVKLLPPAWQYPEITYAGIILGDKIFASDNYSRTPYMQSSDIVINGIVRGSVNVGYLAERPILFEGPFLREERNLIDTVARETALIIERKESEENQAVLEEQLRHADRLATIGQLAAGIAHELNEPLSGILGFAQLAQKKPGLPDETSEDIGKIVRAALHAREVVRKLLIFGRQMPSKKNYFNLNKLVKEGFYFLESRASKEHISMVHDLADNLPEIYADPAQLHQVLVNLMVNAMQAMPGGGTLTIRTFFENNFITLIVNDTGIGMPEDVKQRVFLPFFTTKDVGEGTGLGLSVVHGIVTSHGGTITVESAEGKGSSFIIKLPVAPETAKSGDRTK